MSAPKQWQLRTRILDLAEPKVVGILNLTPDSFSDGGLYLDPVRAVARAIEIQDEGADVLELGAESTRPGAGQVDTEEEWFRLAEVLQKIQGRIQIPISIDTRRGEIARRALKEGAEIINDVSGGGDPALLKAVAEHRSALVVMHMRGNPATMMERAQYDDVVFEVQKELKESLTRALESGIEKAKICLDPGFGFAKTPAQNTILLKSLESFALESYPFMIGVSRKRFLREIVGGDPGRLMAAGLSAALLAVRKGANLVRVHDVAPTIAALRTWLSLDDRVKNEKETSLL